MPLVVGSMTPQARGPFAPLTRKGSAILLWPQATPDTAAARLGDDLVVGSALFPRLRHESRELRSHVRPLARGARQLSLRVLRDRHDELEGFLDRQPNRRSAASGASRRARRRRCGAGVRETAPQ